PSFAPRWWRPRSRSSCRGPGPRRTGFPGAYALPRNGHAILWGSLPSMSPVLTIDAGTTGLRAMVIRDDGTVAARAYREFPQSFPRPGWVEHDPEDWWRALLESTQQSLAEARVEASDLAAVGITNQR